MGKALLFHEFLHVVLRHTEARREFTPERHLALDAVINAIIHRQLGEAYSSMMAEYYGGASGLTKLLRPMTRGELPPAGYQWKMNASRNGFSPGERSMRGFIPMTRGPARELKAGEERHRRPRHRRLLGTTGTWAAGAEIERRSRCSGRWAKPGWRDPEEEWEEPAGFCSRRGTSRWGAGSERRSRY
jgi:hypothetical protein